MKLSNVPEWLGARAVAVLALLALLAPAVPSAAQGVTTGTIAGIELNADKAPGLPVINQKGDALPGAEERKQELGF